MRSGILCIALMIALSLWLASLPTTKSTDLKKSASMKESSSTKDSSSSKNTCISKHSSDAYSVAKKSDCVVVEIQQYSEEWSKGGLCEIFERRGKFYQSTLHSIPVSLVQEIRACALSGDSEREPSLSELGLTPQSLQKKVAELLAKGTLVVSKYEDERLPSFDELEPKIKELFSYKAVEKAALEELSQSEVLHHGLVMLSLPGSPEIRVYSNSWLDGRAPWFVMVADKKKKCYSKELKSLLSKIQPLGALSQGSNDQICQGLNVERTWFDYFFEQYRMGIDVSTAMSAAPLIGTAMKLPGWAAASQILTVEDAVDAGDGLIDIQVKMKDANCALDRFCWTASTNGSRADKIGMQNWDQFLRLRDWLERAVQSSGWISRWRFFSSGRSLIAIAPGSSDRLSGISSESLKFWKELGLSDESEFAVIACKDTVHASTIFFKAPYDVSLITGFGTSKSLKPSINNGKKAPSLYDFERAKYRDAEQVAGVFDRTGRRLRLSKIPNSFALVSGLSYPTLRDCESRDISAENYGENEELNYLYEELKPARQSKTWFIGENILTGEVDAKGKIAIKPDFATIGVFSDGLAPFQLPGGCFGYIDDKGKVVAAAGFEVAMPFYESLAAVKRNGRWGFIDTTGNIAIPIEFDFVSRFSEGLAAARAGAKFGFIDKTGKYVIGPKYGLVRHFEDGLARVQLDGKKAYIDHSGKVIGGRWFDELRQFSDGLAVFRSNDKFGYIDRMGNIVIPAKFSSVTNFRGGVALVDGAPEPKAIDRHGRSVKLPLGWSSFFREPVEDGLFGYAKDEARGRNYGFKDKSGKPVIAPIFENVSEFENGLCPVKIGGKWGVINKAGEFVIKPVFEGIVGNFSNNRLLVTRGEKYGVIDIAANFVVEPKYDRIYPFANGMAVVQKGLKFGYINTAGVEVFPPQFDAAQDFGASGRARVFRRVEPENVVELP